MGNDFINVLDEYSIDWFITKVTGKQFKQVGSVLAMNPCPLCGKNDCFRVWKHTNSFSCFSCKESGNIFNFSKALFSIQNNFENLKRVAEICGYRITNSKKVEQEAPDQLIKQEIFNVAAKFYQDNLENDKTALKILSDTRNYTIKTVKEFNIGYSGKICNQLYNYLKKDYNADQLIKSGLIIRKDGKMCDFFCPKLFVIPHYKGTRVCNFTIKDSEKHKKRDRSKIINYRLPAEFRIGKSYFYNQDALYYDDPIIVEGENDAIQLMRYTGKKNVMAITGNPSKEALEYLKNYVQDKVLYLCFDNDNAGGKYENLFFLKLWGSVKSINKIKWNNDSKDIDEFIRSTPNTTNKNSLINELIYNAPDMLQYLIQKIPDTVNDFQKIKRLLEPFVEASLKNDNTINFDILIAIIKDRFKKGKLITDLLKNDFQRHQLNNINQTDYIKNLPYFEKDGVYWHRQTNAPVNLSNFRLDINDLVIYGGELYYRCTLKSVAGEISDHVEFSPAERVDVRKFRTKITSKGAFHFTGRDHELSGIWQYEEGKTKARYIYYIQQYGYIKNEDIWLFENCAIAHGQLYPRDLENDFIPIDKKNYIPYDVRVYSGARPKLDLKTECSPEFCNEIIENFHYMLDYNAYKKLPTMAGYLFVGFVPAIIYSNEIFDKYGYFPLLFSYGPPGTGKTHATRLLLNFFGFMAQPESWPSASIAGTYQFVQQLSSLPAWYDEFLNDKTFKDLLGTIKNIYNRVGAGKGGKDERRLMREVNACLWLSGEDNPANEAVLSRAVLFRFTALNPHKNEAYHYLLSNAIKLSAITRNLIMEKSDDNVRILLRDIDMYQDYIVQRSKRVDPRVAGNYAVIRASLNLLDIEIPEELDEYVVSHAEQTMKFKVEENITLLFFIELYTLDRNIADQIITYDYSSGEIAIRMEYGISKIRMELRKKGQEFGLKNFSIRDYFKEIPGFIKNGRYYFPKPLSKQCWAFIYCLRKMPEEIQLYLNEMYKI